MAVPSSGNIRPDDPIAAAFDLAAELARTGGGSFLFRADAQQSHERHGMPVIVHAVDAAAVAVTTNTLNADATNTPIVAYTNYTRTIGSNKNNEGLSSSTLEAATMLANFPGRPPVAVSPLHRPQPERLVPSDEEDQNALPHLMSLPMPVSSSKGTSKSTSPLLPSTNTNIQTTTSVGINAAYAAADTSNVSNHDFLQKERREDDGYDDEDCEDDDDENIDGDDTSSNNDNKDENPESRVARSRERNREHARRTRIRKKAQLESLQSKIKGLQAESKALRQSLEECCVASILVGLSSTGRDSSIQALVKEASEIENENIFKIVSGKRKRFSAEASRGPSNCAGGSDKAPTQPLKIPIDGIPTNIGGPGTHINWKTGVYSTQEGFQRKLTHKQLEALRRERNRMHAKMTRDRKKSFILTIEQTIQRFEASNKRMRAVLTEVVQTHFNKNSYGSEASTPGVARTAASQPSQSM